MKRRCNACRPGTERRSCRGSRSTRVTSRLRRPSANLPQTLRALESFGRSTAYHARSNVPRERRALLEVLASVADGTPIDWSDQTVRDVPPADLAGVRLISLIARTQR